jgi:hypothetical protein
VRFDPEFTRPLLNARLYQAARPEFLFAASGSLFPARPALGYSRQRSTEQFDIAGTRCVADGHAQSTQAVTVTHGLQHMARPDLAR